MSTNRRMTLVALLILGGFMFPGASVFADVMQDAKAAYGAGEFEEAMTLLRPLVRQKNKDAAFLLGRMYEQGDGIDKDIEEAKRLFKIAADNGHDEAQQRLDIFDARGSDQSVVVEWYLPSAHEGDTESQYNLAFMYETGWGVPINEQEAVKWYKEAAEMQHDVAQLRLGMMTILGVGIAPNQNDGVDLIRNSAENGNRIAEAIIQDVYDVGELKPEQAARILAGLRRILDEGEAKTLETLRTSLRDVHKRKPATRTASTNTTVKGTQPKEQTFNIVQSVTKKQSDASVAPPKAESTPVKTATATQQKNESVPRKGNMLSFYTDGAKRGDADAQFHLGAMYIKGEEVRRDIEEGVYWMKLAAEQGHEMANTYMELWEDDVSTEALNSTIGVNWLKESGRHWDMDAIFNLGFLYESGRGVSVNFKRATKFYRFAAVEGHTEAKRRLALMKKGNGSVNENITNASSPTNAFPIPPAILIGSGVLILILIVIFFFARRQQNLKMPSVQREEKEVYSMANTTHGMEADDRKFFDELWSDNKVEPNQSTINKAESSRGREGKANSQSTANAPTRIEAEKSPELSEVEKKLAAAVDDLLGVKNVPSAEIEIKSAEAFTSLKEVNEKSGAINSEAKKAKLSETSNKPESQHPVKQEQKTKAQMASPHEEKQARADISLESMTSSGESNSRFGADAFLSNSISRDALATSRVSADKLFADGVAIDEAGKSVGRGGYNPQKLNAESILSSDDISSVAGNKQKSTPQKKFGAAAGLLPKRSVEEEIEQGVKEIHEREEDVSVDVDAPLTENEERSLAEVHYNIGVMFSTGDGVPRNDAQAAKWFLKAAEEGLPAAQFNIAECYLRGTGVSKNAALGMEWMQKAAAAGFPAAREALSKRNQAI